MTDKTKFLTLPPESLEAHGFLQHSPDGKYVCPMCGNGSGEDGTGIDFVFEDGIWKGHCFKCTEGDKLDNFKIIGAKYGLDSATDFKEILRRAEAEFFGHEESEKTSKTAESELHDYSLWYNRAKNDLHSFMQKHGGVYRGILEETYRKNKVGYLPSHGEFKLPYLLIPFTKHYWQTRLAISDTEAVKICGDLKTVKKIKKLFPAKEKAGSKPIMYLDDLKAATNDDIFFAVEGPLDALSLNQLGFKCISFLGSNISEDQQKLLAEVQNKPSVIVMLDADLLENEKSKTKPDKAAKTLRKLGFKACKMFLPDKFRTGDGEICSLKDANDFLQISSDGLNDCLQKMLADAPEEFIKADRADDNSSSEQSSEPKKPRKTSRSFFPDCPVDVVIPYGFGLGKSGIYKRFKGQDSEKITSVPIFVSKISCNQQGKDYTAEICFKLGAKAEKWTYIDMSFTEIFDYRACGTKFADNGVVLTSKNAARLSSWLAELIDTPENFERIPRETYYTQTGWLNGKFIYPGEGFKVKNGNFDYDKAFAVQGDRNELLHLVMEAFWSSPAARLTMGAVFSAPLVKHFGDRNLQYHLQGTSGSGKTALLKLLFACWGNPKDLFSDFNSTQKFVHEHCARFNDLPVWVDEMQNIHPKDRPYIGRNYIYPYSEGKTTGRLTKDVTERPIIYFKGTRLTTSESPISEYISEQGALNRLLEIDAKDIISQEFGNRLHTYFDDTPSYGHFGRQYVESLTPERIKQLKKYKARITLEIKYRALVENGFQGSVEDAKEIPDAATGLNPAHIRYYAAAYTALYAFTTACLESDMANFITQTIKSDIAVMVKKAQMIKQTSNAERFLPVILETLASQHSRFGIQHKDGTVTMPVTGNALGIIMHDGTTAWYPQEINNHLKAQGAFATNDIWRGLHDYGLLIEDNDKNHKYKKHLHLKAGDGTYITPRVYQLKDGAAELLELVKRQQIDDLIQSSVKQRQRQVA